MAEALPLPQSQGDEVECQLQSQPQPQPHPPPGLPKRRTFRGNNHHQGASLKEPSKFQLKVVEDKNVRCASVVAGYSSIMRTLLITGSSDRTVRFHNGSDAEQVRVCGGHRRTVMSVSVSEMGLNGEDPVVVSGSKDGTIILWDPENDFTGESLQMPVAEIRCLSVYQGVATLLLIGSRDGKVVLWNLDVDEVVCTFVGHSGCIHCVAMTSSWPNAEVFDPTHFCIASGGADRSVRVWDIQKPKRRRKKLKHERSVTSIAIASKGIRPLLVSGTSCATITIWDYDSGLKIRTMTGHVGPVNSLAVWESHEVLLISGGCDRTVRVFDVITGENVCICLGHCDEVRSVSLVHHHGGLHPSIASCSLDATLRLWDLGEIINQFYRSDTGDLGARNENEAYLPDFNYNAQEEGNSNNHDMLAWDEEEAAKILKEKAINSQSEKHQKEKKGKQINAKEKVVQDHPPQIEMQKESLLVVEPLQKTLQAAPTETQSGTRMETPAVIQMETGTIEAQSPLSNTPPAQPTSMIETMSSSASIKENSTLRPSNPSHSLSKTEHSLFSTTFPPICPSSSPVALEMASSSIVRSDGLSTKGVNFAVERFTIAQINLELHSVKMKEMASEKLQKRLSEKVKNRRGSRRLSNSADKNDDMNPETKAMEAKKAEMVLEHKLQVARVKDALEVSQKRSSEALKKRLDEVKNNRIMNMVVSDDEETEEEEEEDEAEEEKEKESLLQHLMNAPLTKSTIDISDDEEESFF